MLKASNEMYKINYFMKFNETEAPIYNTVIKLDFYVFMENL